jgi:CsoR family transcriptional regulator, copper-sensing transcriptional repressor
MHDATEEHTLPVVTEAGDAIACGCGCGAAEHAEAGEGRKAVGVDPAIKERNLKRLRRIEGQVRGLQRMVEEDRYCTDILTQISSVHEALRATGRELMRNHLRHCVADAVKSGPEAAERVYDELIELMYRHAR